MTTLEEDLSQAFSDCDVKAKDWTSIKSFLSWLKERDAPTYEHSVQTAIIGTRIARVLGLDPKPMLFAGTLHDIGKTMIPDSVLKKKGRFDKSDYAVMEEHVRYSRGILSNIHPFSAEVSLYHHLFQKEPYPLKFLSTGSTKNVKQKARFFALLLSFADHYDAITTRENSKFGRKLSGAEARKVLLKDFPRYKRVISSLFDRGAFDKSASLSVTKSPLKNPRMIVRLLKKKGKVSVLSSPRYSKIRH